MPTTRVAAGVENCGRSNNGGGSGRFVVVTDLTSWRHWLGSRSMDVCVCVRARARVCVCVCVYVCWYHCYFLLFLYLFFFPYLSQVIVLRVFCVDFLFLSVPVTC